MSESDTQSPDIDLFYEDQLVAQIDLDPIQNAFPWYEGSLVEGPALARIRDFVRTYQAAGLEFDYYPHHPEAGSFEESDLFAYVTALTGLRDARAAGLPISEENEEWLAPWIDALPERLEAYLGFLSFRRWRAVTRAGEIVAGIPSPPSLDLDTMRFAFRPE